MGKASGTSLQQYIVRALFMLMALFFMVIPAYNSTKPDSAQNKSYAFDEGWSVTVRGQQKTNVTLSKYSFEICNNFFNPFSYRYFFIILSCPINIKFQIFF